jgi:hypothetical protein
VRSAQERAFESEERRSSLAPNRLPFVRLECQLCHTMDFFAASVDYMFHAWLLWMASRNKDIRYPIMEPHSIVFTTSSPNSETSTPITMQSGCDAGRQARSFLLSYLRPRVTMRPSFDPGGVTMIDRRVAIRILLAPYGRTSAATPCWRPTSSASQGKCRRASRQAPTTRMT